MKIILVILISLVIVVPTHASDSAWEWNVFGVTKQNFKGRDPIPMFFGMVTSLLVHELGHVIGGRVVGMDTTFQPSSMSVRAYDYDDKSDDQKALFHAGGFIAQVLVGGILTAVPETRHHDFTVGFNGFTALNSVEYAITGGFTEENSDVKNLDYYGYNGVAVAISTGVIGGGFTYINLRNDWERNEK